MPTAQKTLARRCKYLLAALAILVPTFAAALAAPRGSARVYFIRPSGIIPNVFSQRIKINGRLVGTLKDGAYLVRSVPAGSATIEAPDYDVRAKMRLKAGHTYYIGVNLTRPDFIGSRGLQALFYGDTGGKYLAGGAGRLDLLDAAKGRAAIAKLKRIR
jgi:hypothetical protein